MHATAASSGVVGAASRRTPTRRTSECGMPTSDRDPRHRVVQRWGIVLLGEPPEPPQTVPTLASPSPVRTQVRRSTPVLLVARRCPERTNQPPCQRRSGPASFIGKSSLRSPSARLRGHGPTERQARPARTWASTISRYCGKYVTAIRPSFRSALLAHTGVKGPPQPSNWLRRSLHHQTGQRC